MLQTVPREKAVHPKSLTFDQAEEIRGRYREGVTQVTLAIEYDISQAGVSAIIRGKTHREPILVMTREEALERRRRQRYVLNYGISYEDWEAMLEWAGFACEGCEAKLEVQTPHPRTGKPTLRLDHNHTTGTPRGVLCNACNLIIGFASDDPQRLRNLASYLEDL